MYNNFHTNIIHLFYTYTNNPIPFTLLPSIAPYSLHFIFSYLETKREHDKNPVPK